MSQQERLFRLALEALSFRARYVGGKGWELVLNARRGDESWEDAESRSYDHLTSPELADVICSEVQRVLGLE